MTLAIHLPLWLWIALASVAYLTGAGFFGPGIAFATQGDYVRDWTVIPLGLLWPVLVPLLFLLLVITRLLSLGWRQ